MMACLWPVSNGRSFICYAGVRIDRVRGGRQKYKRADPPSSLLSGSKVSQGEYVSYCLEDFLVGQILFKFSKLGNQNYIYIVIHGNISMHSNVKMA